MCRHWAYISSMKAEKHMTLRPLFDVDINDEKRVEIILIADIFLKTRKWLCRKACAHADDC